MIIIFIYFRIHPRDKQTASYRLMIAGMSVAYGKNMGRYQGPMVSAYFIDIGFFTLGLAFDKSDSTIEVRSVHGFEV